MPKTKGTKSARTLWTVLIVTACALPVWVVGQVLPDPPEAPLLQSVRDWSILEAILADPEFEAGAEACFVMGPCFGKLAGVDDGRVRHYWGRCVFGSPLAPVASLVLSYSNVAMPVDSTLDNFRFKEAQGSKALPDRNLVIWDAECYEFLQHVLDLAPDRLIVPLSMGFELKQLVALPDGGILSPPDQKVLVLRYTSAASSFLVTVRAVRLGPSTFSSLEFE